MISQPIMPFLLLRKCKSKELHDILGKANRSLKVRDSYKKDLLTSVEINYDKSQDWYIEQRRYWQNFSNKVKSK